MVMMNTKRFYLGRGNQDAIVDLKKKKILKAYLYVCVCLHGFMHSKYTQVPEGGQAGCWIPRNWSYKWLLVT